MSQSVKSGKSSRSHATTAGGTSHSGHSTLPHGASGSSASTSGLSKTSTKAAKVTEGGVVALPQQEVPTPMMGAEERLSHIRQATTRIQHLLEVHRHGKSVYSAEGQTPPESETRTSAFFAELNDELPFMLMPREHAKSLGHGKDTPNVTKKDKMEFHRRSRIANSAYTKALGLRDQLMVTIGAQAVETKKTGKVLSFLDAVPDNRITDQSLVPEVTGEDTLVYPSLQLQLLNDMIYQLKDLVSLLPKMTREAISTEAGNKRPQYSDVPRVPSRQMNTTQNLQDAVAHLINDVDSLHSVRFQSYVQENIAECHRYSASLPMEAGPDGESVFNMVSVFLLDVAVGVQPGRNARIVLDHFNKFVTLVGERVNGEVSTLERLMARATGLQEVEELEAITEQLKIVKGVMQGAVKTAAAEHKELCKSWEGMDKEFLAKALRGENQSTLVDAKKIFQAQTIERAQAAHNQLQDICLPFVSPEYCRRLKITYGNPCSIRLGLKLYDSTTKKTVTLHSLCTGSGTSSSGIDEFLVPQTEQLWFPFDIFPEVVKGERCVLRGRHNVDMNQGQGGGKSKNGNQIITLHEGAKLMNESGLEEQREVGGYFLLRGGERILRALLMQRANVPLCIDRNNFASSGPSFTSKAVVLRSKRPSGSTSHNYWFSTTTGEVFFSFARRMVWHIPCGLILFCLKNVNQSAVFNMMTSGTTYSLAKDKPKKEMKARAEAFIQHHLNKPYGNFTHFKEYLAVLGRMYRQYQQKANAFHFIPDLGPSYAPGCPHQDAWYGLFMLRRHLMPNLNCDAPTPDLPNHAMNGCDEIISDETHAANMAEMVNWPGPEIEAELETKFDAMIDVLRQLNGFVSGAVDHQGNDIPCYQEVFAPSQILLAAFESSISKYLKSFVIRVAQSMRSPVFKRIMEDPQDSSNMKRLRGYTDNANYRGSDAMAVLHRLLVTGNFVIENEDYFYTPQGSGWVVMADHINFFRFFEQLRVLHRGKAVADMRSSEVRKYPCEAFGFLCMVHSPDGADCGVLNHMTIPTILSMPMTARDKKRVTKCLSESGLVIPKSQVVLEDMDLTVPVHWEGRIVGFVKLHDAKRLVDKLRSLKTYNWWEALDSFDANSQEAHSLRAGIIPRSTVKTIHEMEVIFMAPKSAEQLDSQNATNALNALHSGVYIFTENGRLMRPIKDLKTGNLMFVGTWEHIWLDIAAIPTDLLDAKKSLGRGFTHSEPSGSNLISLTSTTIPYFEHNCSPRNLFQCGLSKQSSGTQLQSAPWRREAKLFRTVTPQRYLVRTLPMDSYGLDDFSLGVNAVIAILAYSGYDMDDAVIINHSSVERGMLDAMITVAKVVDLTEPDAKAIAKDKADGGAIGVSVFHNVTNMDTAERFTAELQSNGMPYRRAPVGLTSFDNDHSKPQLHDESAVYCTARRYERKAADGTIHYEYTKHHIARWRSFDKGEKGWVHNVVPLTYDGADVTSALVVFRIPRHPAVGDKFSSRHGQKGTLPLHVRAFDLPFSSSSGITPDVLINPHAFPSRMTVGMVLEIMGGKVGAVQGRYLDHSAWTTVDEEPVAAKQLGEQLSKLGYQSSGREPLICGLTGAPMEADVFMGICGYQRLRHQVNDKWQSRARTDNFRHRAVTKTGQPVKGRKRHGGCRVGEMERDGLLSHGISEVVMDRLLHVSDATSAYICTQCGGLMAIHELHATSFSSLKQCRYCGTETAENGAGHQASNETIRSIQVPQVLKLWVAELTGVGVRVAMKVD